MHGMIETREARLKAFKAKFNPAALERMDDDEARSLLSIKPGEHIAAREWLDDLIRNADKLRTTTKRITPALALAILRKNVNNKLLRWDTVSDYAEAMMRGDWYHNPDPIAFRKDGRLIDGQHRVYAALITGISPVMCVSTGVAAEHQWARGWQTQTKITDRAKMRGVQNPRIATPVAQAIRKHLDGDLPFRNGPNNHIKPTREFLDWMHDEPDLQAAVATAVALKLPRQDQTVVAAFVIWELRKVKAPVESIEKFFGMFAGRKDAQMNTPAFRAREQIAGMAAGQKHNMACVLHHAWNRFVQRRMVRGKLPSDGALPKLEIDDGL